MTDNISLFKFYIGNYILDFNIFKDKFPRIRDKLYQIQRNIFLCIPA